MAIRTRTVDLLGKTDQTYYYRNDLNCFKDPTCILLHWALPSTDNLYHLAGTVEYETSYTFKFIERKEVFLSPLYSLCLALNGMGIYLINYQITGGFYLIWQLN
ncbi:hypothetical protein ZIOFF_071616 [Zingiber officinale]|uniref:Uncharacterized protein n=1 Tax=Zingiber officinale TaxID=94328 RepID=A0A8J5C1Q3_ZINOF|nr:hypothetical protein ZIOFF_071616 [Zingiber officinale]